MKILHCCVITCGSHFRSYHKIDKLDSVLQLILTLLDKYFLMLFFSTLTVSVLEFFFQSLIESLVFSEVFCMCCCEDRTDTTGCCDVAVVPAPGPAHRPPSLPGSRKTSADVSAPAAPVDAPGLVTAHQLMSAAR